MYMVKSNRSKQKGHHRRLIVNPQDALIFKQRLFLNFFSSEISRKNYFNTIFPILSLSSEA